MIMYFPGQAKSLGYQQVYLQPMLMNSYMYNVPKIKHTEQTTEKILSIQHEYEIWTFFSLYMVTITPITSPTFKPQLSSLHKIPFCFSLS